MSKPKHGEEKNRRIESSWEKNYGIEQTVSERYCAVCHEWKTAKGILGGFGCSDCGTSWDQKF
jgi:hypothetical protein